MSEQNEKTDRDAGPLINGLTEYLIKRYSDPDTFSRGERHLKRENLISIEKCGSTISGEINDGDLIFKTEIGFDRAGIIDLSCTCGGQMWCEHMVAVLLMVLRYPGELRSVSQLDTILDGMDTGDLKRVILNIAEKHEELETLFLEELRQYGSMSRGGAAEGATTEGSLPEGDETVCTDLKCFTSSVDLVTEKYCGALDSEEAIADLSHLMEKDLGLMMAIDGYAGLSGLEYIINSFLYSVTNRHSVKWLDLYGSLSSSAILFFEELDASLAKSLLVLKPSKNRRSEYLKKMRRWKKELAGHGAEHIFDLTFAALKPELFSSGAGSSPDGEDTESLMDSIKIKNIEGSSVYTKRLVDIRLDVLEMQERYQEYIDLAFEAQRFSDCQMMLVKLGRVDELILKFDQMLISNFQALSLAEELRRAGYIEEALTVAEKGLTLEGDSIAKLAFWLSERYDAAGDNVNALRVLVVAFKEEPFLNDFLRIKELTREDDWPELRRELLSYLEESDFNRSQILDILLSENFFDKAVSMVEDHKKVQFRDLLKVMDAVIESHSEWVIDRGLKISEEILRHPGTRHYSRASALMGRARRAFQLKGMSETWNTELDNLQKKYSSKLKFVWPAQL